MTTTATLDDARSALDALKAQAADDTIDPQRLALAALIVGEHVDQLLAVIADQQRALLIANGAITSAQASLTAVRRECDQHKRTALLAAETLARSEGRPCHDEAFATAILDLIGAVRDMADSTPRGTPTGEPTSTPTRPPLITNQQRRWSAAHGPAWTRP